MRFSILVLISSLSLLAVKGSRHLCYPTSIVRYKTLGNDIQGTQNGENFGVSVSLNQNGTILAIGAERYNKRGRVQVYQKDGLEWKQMGRDLIGTDTAWFGTSVQLSDAGDRLVLGSREQPGALQVYFWNDVKEWEQLGTTITGKHWWETFGSAVAISGDGNTIMAGDPDHEPRMTGQVRIYRLSCTGDKPDWIQVGDALTGRTAADQFGIAVAVSRDGSVVASGAPFNERHGQNAGHARVYRLLHTWRSKGRIVEAQGAGDCFGYGLALSANGEKLAVGARERLDTRDGLRRGYVRMFQFKRGGWEPLGDRMNGTDDNDEFGTSVSLSEEGDYLAVSTPYGRRYARVYHVDEEGLSQIGEDLDGTGEWGAPFGRSVAISGNGRTVAVGATAVRGVTSDGFPPGYVRIFEAETDRC